MKGGIPIEKRVVEASAVFGAVFFAAMGAVFLYPHFFIELMAPELRQGAALADVLAGLSPGKAKLAELALIFLKNLSVAVIALISGIGPARGLPAAFICALNGAVTGTAITAFHAAGMPYLLLAGLLLPHGVVELPAIFLACGMGYIMAKSKTPIKQRFKMGMRYVAPLLGAAAMIEVLVTPHVGMYVAKIVY